MQDKENIIMGLHALTEVLHYTPDRIKRVYLAFDEKGVEGRKQKLIEELKKERIIVEKRSMQELTHLVSSDSHSGVVALLHPRVYLDLDAFLQKASAVSSILAVDNITDPHNLGAILRAADCFGVDAVLFSKNRGVSITPVVTKSSSGASEFLPLVRVSNLHTSLLKLQKEGYQVLIADIDERAVDAFTFSFPEKFVLVMGSEEDGVQPLVRKIADAALMIPMFGKIDSLNVSQATASLLTLFRKSYPLAL